MKVTKEGVNTCGELSILSAVSLVIFTWDNTNERNPFFCNALNSSPVELYTCERHLLNGLHDLFLLYFIFYFPNNVYEISGQRDLAEWNAKLFIE